MSEMTQGRAHAARETMLLIAPPSITVGHVTADASEDDVADVVRGGLAGGR
jgi:hypothetical protein